MNLRDLIRTEADQCVKCGLCLPHCPTYGKTLDEGDSPRGRIALMQALAEDRLPAQGRLAFHLDRCLACRACERVCPSTVRYGQLIDAARALIRSSQPAAAGHRFPSGLLAWLAARPGRMRNGARLLRLLYQRSGLQSLARHSGLLRLLGLERLDGMIPKLTAVERRREYYPPAGPERGRVALFAGCISDIMDRTALDASIRLLTLCGYGVHVPAQQSCCGALALHGGDMGQAIALAQQNLAVFNALKIDAVLYTASGCGTTLGEYRVWAAGDRATRHPGFTAPVMDVTRFLADLQWPEDLSFRPLDGKVVIQDPCLQRNVVRDPLPPYQLLEKIPGVRLSALPGNGLCCGAAGDYMLNQPELADALRMDKIAALRGSGAGMLVTSNIGCAVHLAAGIHQAGMDVEVIHPVALLHRQLKNREG